MSDIQEKSYPAASSELTKLFKMFKNESESSHDSHGHAPVSHVDHGHSTHAVHAESEGGSGSAVMSIVKAVVPFIFVFAVALVIYYFFFSGFDFSSIIKSTPKAVTPQETAIETLEKQGLTEYTAWVKGFYFDVSDPKVLDPNTDNSGNGLTNFQKYLLNLNPKAYDSRSVGMADSETLAKGLNPQTGKPLTKEQQAIVDKYFDLEIINNRLALSKMTTSQARVAGLQIRGENPDGQQTSHTVFGNTGEVSGLSGAVAPSVPPINGNDVDIDQSIPGRLEIPSLKINVPVVFTQDPKTFDNDLQIGVVHYPGTALPGQIGTSYISGHSSNYVWAKGSYNQVFKTLGSLPENSSFKITVVQKNGKDAIFHYVVRSWKEYSPTDAAQFQNTGKSTVALSTCWPVGSTKSRLVVTGELTQVEK